MFQRWERLLFAHWPVDAALLSERLPPGIDPDLWEGRAWVGVTPFEVTSLRPRLMPRVARFPEINVRTYVTFDGKPGIWFLSLDAASRPAVFAARTERCCLYTLDVEGGVLRGEIDHREWPLQPAVAEIGTNTMASPDGLELEGEPRLHFAGRQDVVIWPLAPA